MVKTEISGKLPFLMNFIERLDQQKFERAIESHNRTSSSYDPKTQTSSFGTTEGTALTYKETGTSLYPDTEQDDT